MSDGEDVLDLIGGNENYQDSDHGSGDELQNEGNQVNEVEAQEDNADAEKKVVAPVSRRAKSNVPRLTTALLKGPKGVHTIEKYFEGFKFYGKGREKEDLDRIMKRIEHWCHRLYPKFNFDDCLAKVEHLGNKRDLQVFLKRYRMDEISADDDFRTPEFLNEDDERREDATPQEEFDLLLAEQINKQRQSEAAVSANNAFDNLLALGNNPPVTNEKPEEQMSDEIKERIERNRILAMERKKATIKRLQELQAAKTSDANQEASASDNNAVQTLSENASSNINDNQNTTSETNSNLRDVEMEDVSTSVPENASKNNEREEMKETETNLENLDNELITDVQEPSLEQIQDSTASISTTD